MKSIYKELSGTYPRDVDGFLSPEISTPQVGPARGVLFHHFLRKIINLLNT